MGIISFLKTKKGPPASQIGEIEVQLGKVRGEMSRATAIIESHGQRRADLLLSDASTDEIIKLDAEAVSARVDLERYELVERALEDQLAAARDSVSRSTRAAELERSAAAIDDKTKALDIAIAAVAVAFSDLVKAVPGDSGVLVDADHMTRPATAEDVARAILSAGMFNAAPSAFEMIAPRMRTPRAACVERILSVFVSREGMLTRYNPGLVGEECSIPPTVDAAQQIVVGRLRAQAARLRDSADVKMAAE